MEKVYIRVKGIIKKDGEYLIVKKWTDDRIPDPFRWEFVEEEALFGEAPVEAVLRGIRERLDVEGRIERILYTWSNTMGDTQCVGIAFLCTLDDEAFMDFVQPEEYGGWKWVKREDFEDYIDNKAILEDLEGVAL